MTNQPMPFSALLERSRHDSSEAAHLLEGYRSYLRLLARTGINRSLRGKADASDIVQETMLKATEHFASFRGVTEAQLVGWLRQILCQNLQLLARHYGTASRRVSKERALERYLDESSVALETLGRLAKHDKSESVLSSQFLGVVVATALAKLSDDDREVIVLRNFEQLEWSQVADRMDRSAEATRKLWGRAIQRLRPLIELEM